MNRNLYLILGGMVFFNAILSMVLILTPLAAAAMGQRGVYVGILVALPGLLGLLTDVPAAVVSNKVGRRPLLLLGGAICTLASLVFALSHDYLWLFMGMILFGLGSAMFSGPALSYITEAALPENQARVQGYNGGVQGMGGFLGALLAGLFADTLGFDLSFVLMGVLSFCAFALMVPLTETYAQTTAGAGLGAIARGYAKVLTLIRTREQIRMASLVVIMFGVVFIMIGTAFFPIYATAQLGYSATITGVLIGLRNLLSTAASPFFGRAVQRFGVYRPVLITHALGSLTLLFIPWNSALWYIALLFGLQGFGFGFTAAGANTFVTLATFREERILGFASVSLVMRVTMLTIPPLLGLLAELGGLASVFLAGGFLACLCAAQLARMIYGLRQRMELAPQTGSEP